MSDTPNFTTWNRQVLEKFAAESYEKLQIDATVIEQLRQDNKDLSEQLRALLRKETK